MRDWVNSVHAGVGSVSGKAILVGVAIEVRGLLGRKALPVPRRQSMKLPPAFFGRSPRRPAAVDDDCVAGNERSCRRSEEDDRPGDL